MNLHHLKSPPAAQALLPSVESRLPNVLYIVNSSPANKFGSMEEQIVFLHRAFAAEGSRFVPLFSCPDKIGATDAFGTRGVDVPTLDLSVFRWRTLRELRHLCAANGIDLIHWQFTEPVANPYLWWLSIFNPTIRHFYSDRISRPSEPYSPPTGWRQALKRLLLKRYAKTWCVSRFVQTCLARQGTWSNVHVCKHFINTDRFAPNAAVRARMRKQLDAEQRFVALVIAQLIPEKGVDVALRALAELPERAVLWIAGAGSQANELQTLAHTLGVEERVRFLGLQRQVEPYLQAADCLVLPSRWQEAAGLVLLEAQSAGLPVVASRIGGIPEYVDEGRSGFLFTPESAAELADHLRTLCADAGLSRRMGAHARVHVIARHSVEAQMGTWLDLYRS